MVLVHRVQHASVARHRLQVAANIVRHPMNAVAVQGLTGLAGFFVGRKRVYLREEWRSHLAGEGGQGLAPKDQVQAAWGFVWAAVIIRFHDADDLAWRPIDAILRSSTLSNLFVWIPVLAAMLAVVHHDGLYALIANNENLTVLGVGLYAMIRVGRWYRR